MKNFLSIKKSVPYNCLVLLLLPAFLYSTDVITTVVMILLSTIFILLSILLVRFTEKYLSDYVSIPILLTVLGLFYFIANLIPIKYVEGISKAAFAAVFLALYEYNHIKQFFDYSKKSKLIKRHTFISVLLITVSVISEFLSGGTIAGFKVIEISYPFFKTPSATLMISAIILYIISLLSERFINLKSEFQIKKGTVKFTLYTIILSLLVNSVIYLLYKFVLSPFSLAYLQSVLTFTLCGCIYPILKYLAKKINIGTRAITVIPFFVLLTSMYTASSSVSFLNMLFNTLLIGTLMLTVVGMIQILTEMLNKKEILCAPYILGFMSVVFISFDYIIKLTKLL